MDRKEVLAAAKEAVRKHYNCRECYHWVDCEYGTGCNTAYDCMECGGDEFVEGYLAAADDSNKLNRLEKRL